MKIRGLDTNHDWQFGQGLGSYRKNGNAVGIRIKTRLLEWKGDCFFNKEAGVDYINRFDKGQETLLEAEVRTVIANTEEVTKVTLVSVNLSSNRTFSMQYIVDTIYQNGLEDNIII